MQVVVLSPHRDDAAFSCGLTLSRLVTSSAAVTIVNICTVSSYAPFLPPGTMDRLMQVTAAREQEDGRFAGLLTNAPGSRPVELVDLAWQDVPVRWNIEDDAALAPLPMRHDEVEQLSLQLHAWQAADLVLAPSALGGHIDHRLVRQVAEQVFPAESLVFYQDLPYACQEVAIFEESAAPEQSAWLRREWLPSDGQEPGLKRAFALCYPSQIAPELADTMERYAARHNGRECFTASDEALRKLAQLLQAHEVAV